MSQHKNGLACKVLILTFGVLVLPKVYADENTIIPNTQGEAVYHSRCVLCHGDKGLGDGRLAKIINAPAPADFTKSKRSKAYMIKIVRYGGQVMDRSPQMPSWGQELSEQQLEDVVDYIYSLRRPSL